MAGRPWEDVDVSSLSHESIANCKALIRLWNNINDGCKIKTVDYISVSMKLIVITRFQKSL